MSTPAEQLQERIGRRFPEARVDLDTPRDPRASWWLDVSIGEQRVTVEWRPSRGFGVSARPDAVFGEGADEVHDSVDAAFRRITQLLLSGTRTAAPAGLSLSDLRRRRAISQEELARRLEITQASVSKMERRDDVLLGTLKSLVHAMGGDLEIRAHFDDEVIRIHFDPPGEGPAESRTTAA